MAGLIRPVMPCPTRRRPPLSVAVRAELDRRLLRSAENRIIDACAKGRNERAVAKGVGTLRTKIGKGQAPYLDMCPDACDDLPRTRVEDDLIAGTLTEVPRARQGVQVGGVNVAALNRRGRTYGAEPGGLRTFSIPGESSGTDRVPNLRGQYIIRSAREALLTLGNRTTAQAADSRRFRHASNRYTFQSTSRNPRSTLLKQSTAGHTGSLHFPLRTGAEGRSCAPDSGWLCSAGGHPGPQQAAPMQCAASHPHQPWSVERGMAGISRQRALTAALTGGGRSSNPQCMWPPPAVLPIRRA